MIRTRLDSSETTAVELDGVKDVAMRVLLGAADGMPNFSMRHFVVQPGGHTPNRLPRTASRILAFSSPYPGTAARFAATVSA